MEDSKNHFSEETTKGFAKSSKDQKLNVYVWDMDETIILLKSLLNGTYGEAFCGSKDIKRGEELGKIWEKQILDLCDHHFFYEQVRLRFLHNHVRTTPRYYVSKVDVVVTFLCR